MKKTNRKSAKGNFRAGSALILAVVLTTLLAIIGVTFVMSARVDKMATAGVSENKELNYAVESVVTKISQLLAVDVPGPNNPGQEYYDYPDSYNRWLASLEPYYVGPDDYRWQQISDVYGQLDFGPGNWVDDFGDLVGPGDLLAHIIQPDRSVGGVTDTVTSVDQDFGGPADADGDGVSDSRWIKLPDMTSSKGKPVYAAIRIVDNCAMININTAFRDPTGVGEWDGSRLSHVNLEGIISSKDITDGLDVLAIQIQRYGSLFTLGTMPLLTTYNNDTQYDDDVAWRLLNPRIVNWGPPVEAYAPFDISDELELRNRFLLFSSAVTRCAQVWPVTFNPPAGAVGRQLPYGSRSSDTEYTWFNKVTPDIEQPDLATPQGIIGDYNRRHLSTTYSFDRTLRPPTLNTAGMPTELQIPWTNWEKNGMGQNGAQVCVTDYGTRPDAPTVEQIAAAIWLSLSEGLDGFDPTSTLPPYAWAPLTRTDVACQLAVNLVDYIDTDLDSISIIADNNGISTTYYGYEENNAYISEIAIADYNDGTGTITTYYALELYNPDPNNPVSLAGWKLVVGNTDVSFTGIEVVPAGGTLVIVDSAAATGADGFNTGTVLAGLTFADDDHIVLLDPAGRPVDGIYTGQPSLSHLPPYPPDGSTLRYSLVRDNWLLGNKIPVWNTTEDTWNLMADPNELGIFIPGVPPPNCSLIQVTTRNDGKLPTIGEIFSVLGIGASFDGTEYKSLPEWFDAYRKGDGTDLTGIAAGRLDASHGDFANLMRFLTVFGPFSDSVDNDGNGKSDNPASDGADNDEDGLIDGGDPDETFANYGEFTELAVAGRININTAPWYVIAQLPWVTNSGGGYELAQAIVAYRDKLPQVSSLVDYSAGRQVGMGNGPPFVREEAGFANITELMNVTNDYDGSGTYYPLYDIRRYGRDGVDNDTPPAPDFSDDSVIDDLEERDIIFSRISNLVTVRSDVFTAYILVRIGADGPQKRVIAIFDRSNVFLPTDKPKLVALHPVPDPR